VAAYEEFGFINYRPSLFILLILHLRALLSQNLHVFRVYVFCMFVMTIKHSRGMDF